MKNCQVTFNGPLYICIYKYNKPNIHIHIYMYVCIYVSVNSEKVWVLGGGEYHMYIYIYTIHVILVDFMLIPPIPYTYEIMK